MAEAGLSNEDIQTDVCVALKRNWDACYLCQKSTGKLTNPKKNTRLLAHPGELENSYTNVVNDINTLRKFNHMPDWVIVDEINDDNVIKTVGEMKINNACWHKHCRTEVIKERVKRAQKREPTCDNPSPIKTRRLSLPNDKAVDNQNVAVCFICDEIGDPVKHKVATFGIDKRVREAASIIGDRKLMGKLSVGDMIAQDAEYHLQCLAKLYQRANTASKGDNNGSNTADIATALVFEELTDYIESYRGTGKVFKMSELVRLYDARLTSMGHANVKAHTTRLRADLIAMIPDLREVGDGCGHTKLVFDVDLSSAVIEMQDNSCRSEVSLLAKAVKILRRHTVPWKLHFSGSFDPDCHEKSVPPLLLTFYSMLLDGLHIIDEDTLKPHDQLSKVVSTLAELTIYNTVSKRSSRPSCSLRHIKERETPTVIYNAVKLYQTTRKESLVDAFHDQGLCISYDRLRSLRITLSHSVISRWNDMGVVVPLHGLKGVLTGGMDNLDHDPTSTTAISSFHGSGISLTFHPTSDNLGTQIVDGDILRNELDGMKTVQPLPTFYTEMKDVSLKKDGNVNIPVYHLEHTTLLST